MMTRRNTRPGFSLPEILVVCAIIATLIALTTGAVMSTIGSQENERSRNTIRAVSLALDQQWKKVVDDAMAEQIPIAVQNLAKHSSGTADALSSKRARVMWIKMRLKQEFPMTYNEARDPCPGYLSPRASYVKDLNGISGTNPLTESAACLLMALKIGRGGHDFNADALGGTAIADTDNDKVKELVDGAGMPLGFCRWPVQSAAVDATFPGVVGATSRDPQDPDATLLSPAWNVAGNTNVGAFETVCHSVGSGMPVSKYLIPVVASPGRNRKMGLGYWMNITNAQEEKDNIYSFNLK